MTESGALVPSGLQHRDGVPWYLADPPPADHEHWGQTSVSLPEIGHLRLCPCGALDDGTGWTPTRPPRLAPEPEPVPPTLWRQFLGATLHRTSRASGPDGTAAGPRLPLGTVYASLVLSLLLPLVGAWAVGAATAADRCASTDLVGICDPQRQTLAVAVPLYGWSLAVVLGWVSVLLPARARTVIITVCCTGAVACLAYGHYLAGSG